ncbi:hypothetical protein LL912_00970 [Niabella sp. CC-SYL272]|uniref:hypothetical protein n=1 Tax=Niabella agricola TaxID=2891571 RepID=UPI001F429635|nr:hypothetical protein [Niabella agricola]MCF3107339.1 hypothetical protein [Niabella agricola]
MIQVDYRPNAHLYVTIEMPEYITYASLNFHYRPAAQDSGIEPNADIIHGYVLDPVKGSLIIVLAYDQDLDMYLLKDGDQVDSEILYQVNEAIKNRSYE